MADDPIPTIDDSSVSVDDMEGSATVIPGNTGNPFSFSFAVICHPCQ